MKKPVKTNVRFKDYSPGQSFLLPPSLEEMIDANHRLRIVIRVIDKEQNTHHRISGIDQRGSQIGDPVLGGDLSAGRSRVAVMRPARPQRKYISTIRVKKKKPPSWDALLEGVIPLNQKKMKK